MASSMKIIKHRSLKALQNSAVHYSKEVFETGVSWSFRIFEKGSTKEFHVFYKPDQQSNFVVYNIHGNLRNKSK